MPGKPRLMPTSKLVDVNVLAFSALDSNTVFVLTEDQTQTLWCEHAPDFYQQSREKVDQDVPFVVLRLHTGFSGDLAPWTRALTSGVSHSFRAVGTDTVFVRGATERTLWREDGPGFNQTRIKVDIHVLVFFALDPDTVFVLSSLDSKLWREHLSTKTRFLVEEDVAAFQVIDVDTVFVLRYSDTLLLAQGPFRSDTGAGAWGEEIVGKKDPAPPLED